MINNRIDELKCQEKKTDSKDDDIKNGKDENVKI